jgi:hypothetical protein
MHEILKAVEAVGSAAIILALIYLTVYSLGDAFHRSRRGR